MKRFDVCGIGNSLVDVLVQVPEEFFRTLEFEKGSSIILDSVQQSALLKRTHDFNPKLASGGSVANSIVALAQLGGRGAFITSIGDDRYGLHYSTEFSTLGVELLSDSSRGEVTGTCLVLITPDGERTMRFSLGAAAKLNRLNLDEQGIAESKWLFVEGYLLANPASSLEAVHEAIKIAKKNDTKIALTLSEPWVVSSFRTGLDTVLPLADLVFANEVEAGTLTGKDSAQSAFDALRKICPSVIVTAGENGVHVCFDQEIFHTPAFACRPLDLTGAGDMLAGAFLYGITNGVTARQSAQGACYLSREVITRVGARLHGGVREYWDSALSPKRDAKEI